jgi:quercetin dioxygenase-like cupin family protein
MTFAHWNIDSGTTFPEHSHPHEQICCVLEGRLELSIGPGKQIMEAGSIAVIPSGVPHSGLALTECRVIDVFHPVREDLKETASGG